LDLCEYKVSAREREKDAGRLRTECSFDAGFVERKGDRTKIATTAKRSTSAEEMASLRDDHRTLRQEVAALREEFCVLKYVLLKPRV
jgi:hypothetical protein